MLHAYRPVLETLRGGGGGGSDDGSDDGDGRRDAAAVGIEEGDGKGISCPVSIIYGSPDQDWMPHRWFIVFLRIIRPSGVVLSWNESSGRRL